MKREERIQQMELRLNQASAAVQGLSAALETYMEAQKDLAALDKYYGSPTWRADLKADEEGRLPAGLKRGVLSEDAVWNLLSDSRELNVRLAKAASKLTQK